jgi:Transposase domain (DUF772)
MATAPGRSSRQIERRCREDIAFRVLAGNRIPDHVTIARFRVRHEQALAGLLVASLKLCAAAGMVRLGLLALDGTKVEANAAAAANRTHAHLEAQVAELLQHAAEADRVEDREYGAARGDEPPQALATRAQRLARLQQAKAQLEAEAAAGQQRYQQRVAELAAAARARGQRPRAPWGARSRSLVMLRVRIRGSGRPGHRGGGSAWRLAVPLWLGALTTRAPTGRGCGEDDGGCRAGGSCGGREGGDGGR